MVFLLWHLQDSNSRTQPYESTRWNTTPRYHKEHIFGQRVKVGAVILYIKVVAANMKKKQAWVLDFFELMKNGRKENLFVNLEWVLSFHSGTVVIKSISLEKLRALSLVSPKLFGIEYVTQLENLSWFNRSVPLKHPVTVTTFSWLMVRKMYRIIFGMKVITELQNADVVYTNSPFSTSPRFEQCDGVEKRDKCFT